MSLFEFLCGGLSDLRSRRTSAYEIAGEVVVVTTSSTKSLPGRKSVSTAMSDTRGNSGDSRRVAPSVDQSDVSTHHLPYSMGNPLINLGFNILLRGIEASGYDPLAEERMAH